MVLVLYESLTAQRSHEQFTIKVLKDKRISMIVFHAVYSITVVFHVPL